MKTKKTACCFMLLPFLHVAFCSPILKTALGDVQGSVMVSSNGRQFYAFRSIPYAKAPVGDLRFQDPVEFGPWSGTLNGTQESPACLQISPGSEVSGTEDCLYLSIYTHKDTNSIPKYPVMVWIHGGAFFFGSGNGETDLYGPEFFLDRDVVLVTFNYRLGPLGFLSTEDDVSPGNYGLLDQEMALQWMKRNIESFGGDSESITIFGESAGGASVELHVLSNRSKGLFHRAISQSGSALCSWAVSDAARHYTSALASHLNCSVPSSQDLVNCLRKKDAHDIVNFRKELNAFSFLPMTFGPRIDRERERPFLSDYPVNIVRKRQFKDVPLITGVTANEGASVVGGLMAGNRVFDLERDIDENLPVLLNTHLDSNGKERTRLIHEHYFPNRSPVSQNLPLFEQLLSDNLLFSCWYDSLNLHMKHKTADVFAYWYNHRGQVSFAELAGSVQDLGVSHGDELFMMFSSPFLKELGKEEDRKVSRMVLDLWTSFAKTGKPVTDETNIDWPPLNNAMRFLNLSVDPSITSHLPFMERLSSLERFLHNKAEQLKTEL